MTLSTPVSSATGDGEDHPLPRNLVLLVPLKKRVLDYVMNSGPALWSWCQFEPGWNCEV